ncbi:MAG: helicase-related protein [Candidatus Accumulibacter delftensis]
MPKAEKELATAVRAFCAALKRQIIAAPEARTVLNFAIEVLRKRLLSSSVTFADSWLRFKAGLEEREATQASEVVAARRALQEDIDDDQERESRNLHATHVVGSWMHPYLDALAGEVAAVDAALHALKLDQLPVVNRVPSVDARFDRLKDLVKQRLRNAESWNRDERLIVFTEYKTTLDYVVQRLGREFGAADGAIIQLYGGMSDEDRERIKLAFNDPDSPVQILVATDAASEGLNLQHTARLLMHFEIPWNPSRLEQRNGRIDRHGQSRDVTIYHFASDDDADLAFVARVLEKVNDIREDLGSVGELFDAAFQRRMMEFNDDKFVFSELEREIRKRQTESADARVQTQERGTEDRARFERLLVDLDLSPVTLQETLRIALGLGSAQEPMDGPDARGRMRLRSPLPSRWQAVVDDSLRLRANKGVAGAMPWLVFDNQHFIHTINGRPVFRPSMDTVLLHLGHPVMRQALASFARLRFPGGQSEFTPPSRWVVTRGPLPAGADALLLLTVEEMAVNELRETFHHWVRTVALPIKGGVLGDAMAYAGPHGAAQPGVEDPSGTPAARAIWDAVDNEVRTWISNYRTQLTTTISAELKAAGAEATAIEKEAFERRIREVSALQRTASIEKIKREIEEQRTAALQYSLLEDASALAEQKLRGLQDELKRRQSQYGDLQERLVQERDRVVNHVLPARFSLRSTAQVFPVTVEIRLPGAAA